MYIRHILPEPEQGVMPLNPQQGGLTGVVNIAFHLALQQARDGHRVEMLCPSEDQHPHQQIVENVQIRWLPLMKCADFPRYDLRWFLPLARNALTSSQADITHVHNNPYLLIHSKSKSSILHFHNVLLRGSSVYDRFVQRAKRVICISEFIRHDVIRQVTYPHERLVTVHNGVELSRFQGINRLEARRQFGIPQDALVVLYAGRVVPEKGFHVLLAAWEQVIHNIGQQFEQPLVLLVAGSAQLGLVTAEHQENGTFKVRWPHLGAYEQQVIATASKLAEGAVRFIGTLDRLEIPRFYTMGDVFVCPSLVLEGFGLVNVEAMAAGVPVIASAVGGIPEVVQPEFNGLLVPPNDVEALEAALTRLIQDAALRRQMSANAQAFVQKFDWKTIAKQVEAVYAGL